VDFDRVRTKTADVGIVELLGGPSKVCITCGQFFEYLRHADKKRWYIAYSFNSQNVLCAINASWYRERHGWHIKGHYVFSSFNNQAYCGPPFLEFGGVVITP
jgi:hypothetical protein